MFRYQVKTVVMLNHHVGWALMNALRIVAAK
jgi:hypothetical protein